MNKVAKTTDKLLEEINSLPNVDYDKDPEFVADYTNGMIVQQILSVMEDKDISQVELSKKIGKSRQYVSKILNEKTNLTLHSLALFSCSLDCELEITIKNKDLHNIPSLEDDDDEFDNVISLNGINHLQIYSGDFQSLENYTSEELLELFSQSPASYVKREEYEKEFTKVS